MEATVIKEKQQFLDFIGSPWELATHMGCNEWLMLVTCNLSLKM